MKGNKKTIKLFVIFLCLIGAVVSGVYIIYKQKQEVPETEVQEPVEEEKEEEKYEYKKVANSTPLLDTIYEQLLEESEKGSKKEVELAAAYFAVDFFTWSNKEERENVGGVSLVLPEVRTDFASYALRDYYVNFSEFLEEHGKDGLPTVDSYTIVSSTSSDYVYQNDKYVNSDYYDVVVGITYENKTTGMAVDSFVNKVKVTLVEVEDVYYVVAVDTKNI